MLQLYRNYSSKPMIENYSICLQANIFKKEMIEWLKKKRKKILSSSWKLFQFNLNEKKNSE